MRIMDWSPYVCSADLVLAARLAEEYNLEVGFEQAPYETARWISGATAKDLDEFLAQNRGTIADDRDGAPVFMARNAWELSYIEKKWDRIHFHAKRERSKERRVGKEGVRTCKSRW